MMRRFQLVRHEDVYGASGVGIVAEGVQFWTGQCVMCWLSETSSVTIHPSIDTLQAVHCHGGRSVVVWLDPEEEVCHD